MLWSRGKSISFKSSLTISNTTFFRSAECLQKSHSSAISLETWTSATRPHLIQNQTTMSFWTKQSLMLKPTILWLAWSRICQTLLDCLRPTFQDISNRAIQFASKTVCKLLTETYEKFLLRSMQPHLHKTKGKPEVISKSIVNKILSHPLVKLELDFYDFVKRRFYQQLKSLKWHLPLTYILQIWLTIPSQSPRSSTSGVRWGRGSLLIRICK